MESVFENVKTKTIHSLPNEMLRTVFAKLEANQLIVLRVVCQSWMATIEDICRAKTSIVIKSDYQPVLNLSLLSNRFNGLVRINNNTCVILKLKQKSLHAETLSTGFCVLLVKLFPKVENLIFSTYLRDTSGTIENVIFLLNQWSASMVTLHLFPNSYFRPSHHTALYGALDKLPNLKRLQCLFVSHLPNPLTLSRLEHCTLSKYAIPDVVPLLGPNCTSLYLFASVSQIEDITQFAQLNSRLMKCLTHLRLSTEYYEVFSFVCNNFTALRMLHIDFHNSQTFNEGMLVDLARLSNLTQLSIDCFWLYLPTFAQALNLPTLNSVRIITMSRFVLPSDYDAAAYQFDGEQFCRVLSHAFPNVQQLTFKHRDALIRDGISQHLAHFVNLRKHLIDSPEYDSYDSSLYM